MRRQQHTLEQSNSKWKQNVHGPKLVATFIEPVEWVSEYDENQVSMKSEDSGADGRKAADAYGVSVAGSEDGKQTTENDSGPDTGEGDVEDSRTVEIRAAIIMAIAVIEVDGSH